jgi:selenocysteine lyase/cysteine desulfurase
MIAVDLNAEFPGAPGYLNTASIGLPPSRAVAALQAAIVEWQSGAARPTEYDAAVTSARESFATLVAAPVANVAVGNQVSALVGLAATALQPGDTVLCPEGEFTSVSFPFLARGDLKVIEVPLEALADSISAEIALVAFSAVQSATGEIADLAAIREAAATTGTRTLVDATQAAGWFPIEAARYDVMVAGAYKWLLSPRGTAFMTVGSEMHDRMRPAYAGWYAGESIWDSIYGLPLRLAADARRFDLSPAWLSWVGTAPALGLIVDVGVEAIHAHNAGLADMVRMALDQEPTGSAIVSLELPAAFDPQRLEGMATAYRAGRLRVGFHLYNTADDVAKLLSALGR